MWTLWNYTWRFRQDYTEICMIMPPVNQSAKQKNNMSQSHLHYSFCLILRQTHKSFADHLMHIISKAPKLWSDCLPLRKVLLFQNFSISEFVNSLKHFFNGCGKTNVQPTQLTRLWSMDFIQTLISVIMRDLWWLISNKTGGVVSNEEIKGKRRRETNKRKDSVMHCRNVLFP